MTTLVEAIRLGQGLRYLRIQSKIRAAAYFLKHIWSTGPESVIQVAHSHVYYLLSEKKETALCWKHQ